MTRTGSSARGRRRARIRAAALAVALGLAGAARAQPPLPPDRLPADLFGSAVPFGLPATLLAGDDDLAARRRFDLGRRLFFDPLLSRDRTVSCASCHDPAQGFASPAKRPEGIAGRRARRHAPTLFNRALGRHHSWDGRAPSLEAQMLLPIADRDEMDLPLDAAAARLNEDDALRAAFVAAFDAPASSDALARALASFVRRLTFADSPVDRFRAARPSSLTSLERTGLWVFESKGSCWRCHAGPGFSDERFHNTGVGSHDGEPEPGRAAITGLPEDRGRFKTPTLRALALTAPYMHDGSLATLDDVVAFYRQGARPNAHLDPLIAPLDLSDHEAAALVAFLNALSRVEPDTAR